MTTGPAQEWRLWREVQRAELMARRVAMAPRQRLECNRRITQLLVQAFPPWQGMRIASYWPFKGEVDSRPAMRCFKRGGARLGLPVVMQKGTPLQFREWWPGVSMRAGVLGLPVPQRTACLAPQVLLVPLLGFDAMGFRLGLGGGHYDRTLALLDPRPLKIGVGFELSRMSSLHPQPHDVPMDFIVTEAGVHRVESGGLVLIDGPPCSVSAAGLERRRYASPVCYAQDFEDEPVDPG